MNWIIWASQIFFAHVQLVSVVRDLGNEDPEIVVVCLDLEATYRLLVESRFLGFNSRVAWGLRKGHKFKHHGLLERWRFEIVPTTFLGDARHRGFGHGPALRDGGAHHCDDGNFKFEKECETRSHCVSVRQP